jgi:hypothetical protein
LVTLNTLEFVHKLLTCLPGLFTNARGFSFKSLVCFRLKFNVL